ncbi:MAG: hypothetical protein QOG31_915 [Thermoplasmata archaeon]|jgi:DNA-binding IclR family transcriptional regulator|nr:hypothetical protein [Thermoplasmata archaeon]
MRRKDEPVSLKDVDYDVVRSHVSAFQILRELTNHGWISQDEGTKKYAIRPDGSHWLDVAETAVAKVAR